MITRGFECRLAGIAGQTDEFVLSLPDPNPLALWVKADDSRSFAKLGGRREDRASNLDVRRRNIGASRQARQENSRKHNCKFHMLMSLTISPFPIGHAC